MIRRWYGLRCWLRWCPHRPYQHGIRCDLCGKYTKWEDL